MTSALTTVPGTTWFGAPYSLNEGTNIFMGVWGPHPLFHLISPEASGYPEGRAAWSPLLQAGGRESTDC